MRTTFSCILRLFFDPEEQDSLRGALLSVADNQASSFLDERELLQQLHELVRKAGETQQLADKEQ